MKREEFIRRINGIFGEGSLQLKSRWKNKSNEIDYLCGQCNKIHTARADTLLSRRTVCREKDIRCNDKVGQEEFERRLEVIFPNKISIDEWHGITGKLKYHCNDCGENYFLNTARCLLTKEDWCEKCNIARPKHNNENAKQKLDIKEIQKRLDDYEEGSYQILDYQGQLNKSKVRCNKCGFIFVAQMSYFTTCTRGCPKCSRFKSKGEKAVENYLVSNNIKFEPQKRFKDCNNNLSSFDFAVYDANNTMILIEVDGIQHFKQTTRFEDLDIIIKRDKLKNDYCKEKNIQLIRLPYYDLNKIDNYLSFLKGSTTIPEMEVGSKPMTSEMADC